MVPGMEVLMAQKYGKITAADWKAIRTIISETKNAYSCGDPQCRVLGCKRVHTAKRLLRTYFGRAK